MSPDQPPPPPMKDGAASNHRKAAAEPAVKCPRCDSPNTKFCYYNNYSLTQPRHFCKTCRRYWTKGGALRNVPIGGGCRKNKKVKPSAAPDLKFFAGGGLSPAVDFHLSSAPYPRLHNQFSGAGNYTTNPFSSSAGLDHPAGLTGYGLDSTALMGVNNYAEINNTNNSNNLASSIESLSCINQDLHWKLQQQRLAVLFGNGKDQNNGCAAADGGSLQPILFQNLDISSKPPEVSRKEAGSGDVATEWFFGSSYTNHSPGGGGGDHGGRTAGNWSTASSGVEGGWSAMHQNHYSALP